MWSHDARGGPASCPGARGKVFPVPFFLFKKAHPLLRGLWRGVLLARGVPPSRVSEWEA